MQRAAADGRCRTSRRLASAVQNPAADTFPPALDNSGNSPMIGAAIASRLCTRQPDGVLVGAVDACEPW
jgi:hypothetical protein